MSDGLKRRDFLKVLGASGAGAATVGCSTGEVERLIPYVIPSDDIVPGVPTWYASTCRECPAGCGILVETHSGRVTKVEGNPDHPVSHGNLCARGQASVQGLYHPDRFKNPMVREGGVVDTNVTWSTAERLLAQRIQEIRQGGGAGRVVFIWRRRAALSLAEEPAVLTSSRRAICLLSLLFSLATCLVACSDDDVTPGGNTSPDMPAPDAPSDLDTSPDTPTPQPDMPGPDLPPPPDMLPGFDFDPDIDMAPAVFALTQVIPPEGGVEGGLNVRLTGSLLQAGDHVRPGRQGGCGQGRHDGARQRGRTRRDHPPWGRPRPCGREGHLAKRRGERAGGGVPLCGSAAD